MKLQDKVSEQIDQEVREGARQDKKMSGIYAVLVRQGTALHKCSREVLLLGLLIQKEGFGGYFRRQSISQGGRVSV